MPSSLPPIDDLRAGHRMLTVRQVAELLNCTTRIVRRLIQAGRLRSTRYSPRCTRIAERDLIRFLDRAGA